MFIDNSLQLSSAQAVTAATASTNYLDAGKQRDLGVATGLYMLVTCTQTATAAGAATVQFQLQGSASDNTFATPVNIVETDAIPKTSLTAQYQVIIPVPPGSNYRYFRLYYNVGTGPLTAGAFTAQIVKGYQSNTLYPAAI